MTPSRIRLRRRLILLSGPVAVVALVVAAKMISVVIAGHAAESDFRRHDVAALRDDVATLSLLDVIEPDKVAFAKGDLAAVDGRLNDADSRFSALLSRTGAERSCPLRVNLELVRETQGDQAARGGTANEAEQRYRAALAVVEDAPAGCFAGNNDPDTDRRAIRNDAAARLADKIRALHAAPPAPPPQPGPPPPPPPPPPPGGPGSGAAVLGEVDPDGPPGSGPVPDLRLEPGRGHPLDRLQEALRNSDAAGQAAE